MPEDKSPAEDTSPPAEHDNESFFNPFAAPDHDADPPADVEPMLAPADPDPDPEPAPASMSMTKAELLERVQDLEAKLSKSKLLERIEEIEGEKADAPAVDSATAGPVSTETRQATVNGVTLTWTDATAHQVPEEYVLVERRSRGMNA